ncbi:hypothetical protein CEXT_440091, partial [Caerostris extrusa]
MRFDVSVRWIVIKKVENVCFMELFVNWLRINSVYIRHRRREFYYTNKFESGKTDDSTEVKARISDPLEQVLRKSLEELRIYDALWVLDKDENFI